MEENNEIQKKKKGNTDCVYFLASPLTCNKGNECEFRHSETARLNPRDCWYWMSDNCLNPTCAFRHPPLEAYTETPSDPAPVPSVVPSSKASVPCYFYFNSFCIKGDQCPFSHGNDMFLEQVIPKTANNSTATQPQEKKASNGSHTRLSSVEPPPNHSRSTSKDLVNYVQVEDVHENIPLENESKEPSPSTEVSIPEFEEPAVKSDNNDSVGEDTDGREDLVSDQNSEEAVKNDSEPDEWCESSPGFDVLVGNASEQFVFEENIDCRMAQERDPERLQRHLLQYEYDASVGYDPLDYSNADFLQDHAMYDSYDHFDNGYNPDYPHEIFEHSKERVLEPQFFHRRKIPRREKEIEFRNPEDLRHRLRKNRWMDSHHFSHGNRRRRRTRDDNQERIVTFGGFSPNTELLLDVGTNRVSSAQGGANLSLHENHRHGWGVGFRDHNKHSSRRQEREGRKRMRQTRRHLLRSEISNDLDINETMPREGVGFGRPKSFAHIKEEKRGDEKLRNGLRNLKNSSMEFEGPKPLSELLKEKKIQQQQQRENAAECDHYPNEDCKKSYGGYKRRFSDDIDDPEYSE